MDSGTVVFTAQINSFSTTQITVSAMNVAGTYTATAAVTETLPMTFAVNDEVAWTAAFCITGWDGNVA